MSQTDNNIFPHRMLLKEADPDAFKAMLRFDEYLGKSPLTKTHAELIKIRVSQINGCSYCIDKHIRDAVSYGEEHRRIHLLPVWHEVPFFTMKERAILALCEEVTMISDHGVSDEVYNNAISVLGQPYTIVVLMAIISMNAWNRVGITTKRVPE